MNVMKKGVYKYIVGCAFKDIAIMGAKALCRGAFKAFLIATRWAGFKGRGKRGGGVITY